ncbi:MAG: hypothetical protein CVU77_02045 [Elusimicrobia bacterium HGW-Elusimicrobia-1]|jgi:Tol biopolymer transport system component|nr:MAG: hypothetical protein CVU77_02045 [Elusimicrobia bacterium HGW-Elusimicrobia-1]
MNNERLGLAFWRKIFFYLMVFLSVSLSIGSAATTSQGIKPPVEKTTVSIRDGKKIIVADPKTKREKVILSNDDPALDIYPGGVFFDAILSPDGKKIAFKGGVLHDYEFSELWVINANGGGLKKIVSLRKGGHIKSEGEFPAYTSLPENHWSKWEDAYIENYFWSPCSKKIAYIICVSVSFVKKEKDSCEKQHRTDVRIKDIATDGDTLIATFNPDRLVTLNDIEWENTGHTIKFKTKIKEWKTQEE